MHERHSFLQDGSADCAGVADLSYLPEMLFERQWVVCYVENGGLPELHN